MNRTESLALDARPVLGADHVEPAGAVGGLQRLPGVFGPVAPDHLAAAVGVGGPEQDPFRMGGNLEVFVAGFQQIGISLYPNDETAAPALLRSADAAMYEAKKNGLRRIAFYGGLR